MNPATKSALTLALGAVACLAILAMGVTREVPRGGVEGHVVMTENGQPLADADVTIRALAMEKDTDEKTTRYVSTDDDGKFRVRSLPAGAYEISVHATHHSMKSDFIQVTEGQLTQSDIKINPSEREMRASITQHVYLPNENPDITLTGFLKSREVKIEALRMTEQDMVENGGPAETIRKFGAKEPPHPLKSTLTQIYTVKNLDREGAFVDRIKMPTLPQGVYLVKFSQEKLSAKVAIYVTNLAMVSKSSPKQAVCYVTGIDSGLPIGGSEVFVVDSDHLVPVGKTDAQGMCTYSGGTSEKRSQMVARLGDSWASTRFYDDDSEKNTGRMAFVTDRSIYRPGDLVQFKAILRVRKGADLTVPPPGHVEIEILDPDENPVSSSKQALNSHGSVSSSFTTSNEAKPGLYQIHVTADGFDDRHYVSVAAYRKPEYDVKIKPQKDHFIYGSQGEFDVDLNYYFGGPVVGAKLKANIYRNPKWSFEDDSDDEDESDNEGDWGNRGSYGGEYSESHDVVTDDRGHATITFETKGKDDAVDVKQDYDYTIHITSAEGESGPTIDSEDSVLVSRGDYKLSIQPESYVVDNTKATPITIKVRTQGDAKSPVAGVPVTIRYGTIDYRHDNKFMEKSVTSATTDKDGLIRVMSPTDFKTSFEVRCQAKDPGGREIEDRTTIYSGNPYGYEEGNSGRITLRIDKPQYKIGDKATVVIGTGTFGGDAWLTMEGDSVTWSKLVHIEKELTKVEVPIDLAAFPTSYVSVAYVKGKKFFEASKRVSLANDQRNMTVTVTPSSTQVQPGESVDLDISTRTKEGKGVSAEASVSVVDESIYDLQEDNTNLTKSFYPIRSNAVRTNYSFPEIYLDGGDKGASSVKVRSKFLDTAKWLPTVVTDANGNAHCRIPLPDNLTDWRVSVYGATDDTLVGKGVTHVIAKKPVMVRVTLPRFMVKGDRQEVNLSIHNDTDKSQDLHLQLQADGLTIDTPLPNSISLESGKAKTIPITIVADKPGSGSVTAKVWTDHGPSDGVKESMPVIPNGRKTRFSDSVIADGEITKRVELPEGFDRTTAEMRVSFEPTIAASLVRSLDSLVEYPYGCVEQTMSKFLPAVLVGQLLHDTGLRRPELQAKIPGIVQDSLARLGKMQHPEGAWGWWEHDESSALMTSLVLDGLRRASLAGYPNHLKTAGALDWLSNHAKDTPSNPVSDGMYHHDNSRDFAYAAYVLAEYGRLDQAAAVLDKIKEKSPSPTTEAYRAMAAYELGKAGNGERWNKVQQLALFNLFKMVNRNSGLTTWTENFDWQSAQAEPTSIVLLALSTVPQDPTNSEMIPQIAQSLTRIRHGEMWESTRTTSYALIALTKYLSQSKELSADKTVDVILNGKTIVQKHWSPGSIEFGEISIPGRDLKTGVNTVVLRSVGGPVYGQVRTDFYDVKGSDKAVSSSDLVVNRVYRVYEAQQLENGGRRLLPSKKVVSEVHVGDIVQVEIHVNTSKPIDYLLLEDPIPSNFRVVEREDVEEGVQWSYMWSGIQVFDDRVALFITHLTPTNATIRYTLRAESSGNATALPARVEPMYAADRSVSTAFNSLVVKP